MRGYTDRRHERGIALVEFAIGATIFLTVMFAVIEFSRLLWMHNALMDATRRGARYAVLNSASAIDDVKEVVVFGTDAPEVDAPSVVNGLTTANVRVDYLPNTTNFNSGLGTVTVSLDVDNPYTFNFIVSLVGTSIVLPQYSTTCLLYTSPSPRDRTRSRMPSSA